MASQENEDNAPKLLFWEPQEIIKVKVWKREFVVYRELLTQDSEIFRDALTSANDPGEQEIDLGEEFRSWEFGLYVDVLYRSYFVSGFRLRKNHLGRYQPLLGTLSLWKLANRFRNVKITAIATESVMFQLATYSTHWWEQKFLQMSDDKMLGYVKTFEKAALKCEAEDLPFMDNVIQACSNMPPQVYQQHVDKLGMVFATELSKKLTMRFANPNLEQPIIKRSRSLTRTEDGHLPPSPNNNNTVIELDD